MEKEFQTLGDWCKWLERNFSPDIMIPNLPVIVRFDGNNFHNWTKGIEKPFSDRLSELMTETTKFLVQETNAIIGYTQSDEITLILYSNNRRIPIYHDGKKQKILSKLTAKCVTFFNSKRKELLPDHDKDAVFDCRIYQVPTLADACSQLLWRELDATKNSISSLARSYYPHKTLHKLTSSQMQDKLMEKNVNWNNLPAKFKRGVYIKKVDITSKFTQEELSTLPQRHNAHSNPELTYTRSILQEMDYPPLSSIKNKEAVIFQNVKPIVDEYFKIGDKVTVPNLYELELFEVEAVLDRTSKCLLYGDWSGGTHPVTGYAVIDISSIKHSKRI